MSVRPRTRIGQRPLGRTPRPQSRMKRALKQVGVIIGLALVGLGAFVSIAAAVIAWAAVPALAVWALGHFAFGWW